MASVGPCHSITANDRLPKARATEMRKAVNTPASTLSSVHSRPHTKPATTESMPRNMMGPSTKPPATLAATPTTDVEPKVSIETGAVARLAAVVTETWLATGAGRNENRRANGVASSSSPATAANESWKLTSRSVLGLTVRSQAAGASHRSQPSLGRDTSVARSPMTPATPARTMEGEAPVTMHVRHHQRQKGQRARHRGRRRAA